MGFTNFPYGVTSFGIPLVGSQGQTIPTMMGSVWFVDPVNGSTHYDGTSPDNALATIQAAHGKCTNAAGDIIYAFPGTYAENVTISKDRVQLIAAVHTGYGKRVRIEPATGVPLTVTANGFVCDWLRLHSQDTSAAVVQTGDGFIYNGCDIASDSGVGLKLIPHASDGSITASQGIVRYCQFRGNSGAAISLNSRTDGSYGPTDNLFEDCWFYGNSAADIQDVVTGGGSQAFVVSLIRRCFFGDLNKAVYIDLNAGSANTGLISDCHFAVKTGATRLVSSQVLLVAGIVPTALYDSTGLVDTHAF